MKSGDNLLNVFETALKEMQGVVCTIYGKDGEGKTHCLQEINLKEINITPSETGTLKATALPIHYPGSIEFTIKNPKEDVSEKIKKLMRSASGIDKKDTD